MLKTICILLYLVYIHTYIYIYMYIYIHMLDFMLQFVLLLLMIPVYDMYIYLMIQRFCFILCKRLLIYKNIIADVD